MRNPALYEIAAALEEAAHTLAAIPKVFRDLDTGLLERLTSLARLALALTPGPRNPRPNSYPRLVPAAFPQTPNPPTDSRADLETPA